MRTTVGPLPSAVYWRRRAVVLGALLLGVIVLFVSCTGGDDGPKRGTGVAASQGTTQPSAPASSTPDDEPSFSDAQPGGGPALPDPGQIQPSGGAQSAPALPGGAGTGQDANVTVPTDGSCADSEIAVTPVPAAAQVQRGTALLLTLNIRNIGTRSCPRDLGADAQELYVTQGARKFWSSDTCSDDRSASLVQLAPGAEREFSVTWNGRQPTRCVGSLPDGPAPAAGQYELRGRLGTKLSDPVTLTIAG